MSNVKKENMSSIRANFMGWLETKEGKRNATITRARLVELRDGWAAGDKGSLDMPLKYPSWLTNSAEHRIADQRGVFTLPWASYDAFMKLITAQSVTANSTQSPTVSA